MHLRRRFRPLVFPLLLLFVLNQRGSLSGAVNKHFFATAFAWPGHEDSKKSLSDGSQAVAAVGLDEFETMHEA
jgi:hypothetical protein